MARYTGPTTAHLAPPQGRPRRRRQVLRSRPYPPGQHGRGRIKESEYLLQLQEKQKARYTYGVLERQFRRYYEEAVRKSGKTGENLLQILEARLDNVVYRAGLARTRRQARQLVSHGHFIVNGHKVNIPSYRVSKWDIIDVKPKSLPTLPFEVAKATFGDRPIPAWLQVVRPPCVCWCTSSPSGPRSTRRCRSS